jgi:hypothetical protein
LFFPDVAFWTTMHVTAFVVCVSAPSQSTWFRPCLPDATWTTFVFFVHFHFRPGHFGPA